MEDSDIEVRIFPLSESQTRLFYRTRAGLSSISVWAVVAFFIPSSFYISDQLVFDLERTYLLGFPWEGMLLMAVFPLSVLLFALFAYRFGRRRFDELYGTPPRGKPVVHLGIHIALASLLAAPAIYAIFRPFPAPLVISSLIYAAIVLDGGIYGYILSRNGVGRVLAKKSGRLRRVLSA